MNLHILKEANHNNKKDISFKKHQKNVLLIRKKLKIKNNQKLVKRLK